MELRLPRPCGKVLRDHRSPTTQSASQRLPVSAKRLACRSQPITHAAAAAQCRLQQPASRWLCQRPAALRHQRRPLWPPCAAASTAANSPDDVPASEPNFAPRSGPFALLHGPLEGAQQQIQKLDGQWSKFIPMILLFFFMSFVNTVIDSMKDSLVITAAGGGAEVLPYITVYGVLPASFAFLVVYSFATQRLSRAKLFNIIICIFLAFFVSFALLYPHHQALHLHAFADGLATWLPKGLEGAIGMIRNWMFSAFFVSSELWGDIVLSLLFWGLANETTALHEAGVLYPLFGVGANIGQASAGKLLRVFTTMTAGKLTFAGQLQTTMGMVVACGAAILALHTYITKKFPQQHMPTQLVVRAERLAERRHLSQDSLDESPGSSTGASRDEAQHRRHCSTSAEASTSGRENGSGVAEQPEKAKLTLRESFEFLTRSRQVRCLALMAMAQGISTNLLEVAWKSHLHLLHPSPAAYAAFMGDVAMWTGIVTGSLMLCSTILFEKIGWRGVAGITPRFMLLTGVPFFAGCIAWNYSPALMGTMTHAVLRSLVLTGGLLQVFSKGAKFSMFKPAEEMVYITLDDESRTKGKAAIDVVGAQTGKSLGSMLQQGLLLATGGVMAGTLPIMGLAFFFMVRNWSAAVHTLADYQESVTYAAELSDSDSDDSSPLLTGAERGASAA